MHARPLTPRIMIVDDEGVVRAFCGDVLSEAGFDVGEADSGPAALAILAERPADIVITDLRMPGMDGIELLRRIRQDFRGTDVIIATAYGTIEGAVEAIKLGAYDYITKPLKIDDLLAHVRRTLEKRTLQAENEVIRSRVSAQQAALGLIGDAEPMQDVFRLIARVAPRRLPVLIQGESGTGKELIARAIHRLGPSHDQPFVAVDCGAFAQHLIESELFGHVRGSFTDASKDRQGLLAAAGKGTLFLDEIGELPLEAQSRLLRAIQEREYRPIGSNVPRPLHARVVAATNRNLAEEAQAGRFRSDLFYRLNVVGVTVPALRYRMADIPPLSAHFLNKHREAADNIVGFTDAATARLLAHAWPGNVRELENCIARAVAVCAGDRIDVQDLGLADGVASTPQSASDSSLRQMEKRAIEGMLVLAGGNKREAARRLGISKASIYRKLNEYGIGGASGERHESARARS